MRIIQKDTIYQLTTFPKLFPVNCYFIEEDDGLTLVDAALSFSINGIIDSANKIGKSIKRILITHAHDDHVGAIDTLKERIPDVKLYISKRDAKLLRGDRSLEHGEGDMPIRGGVPNNVNSIPDILLQDGDRVGSLLCISIPGHTPGTMAFFDTRNKILIVGDAFQSRGGIAVAGQVKILFPFPAMATWDKNKALESARKLRDLNPSLLAVGHGEMLNNPLNAMNFAIERAEKNLKNKK